jgi:hypothetical protein
MEHNGMEWSGMEWNINFVPLFGYSGWNGTKLPLHHLGGGWNGITYNIFIPTLPLFKNNKFYDILLISQQLLSYKTCYFM